MIRLILRDLFPTRAQVGALRAKTHEVTGHLVAVNAKCADQAATIEHLRNHIESLSAELAEVEAERDALAKRALRPDLGAIEVAFYAGWDKGYHGAAFDRMATTEYDMYDERARAADAYMNEIAKETP